MKRREIFITLILFIFLLFGCATTSTSLKDYEPKSPDEEAIIKVLIKVQDAWNNGNLDGFLAAYHDNGKIMSSSGPRVRSSLSKEDFAKVFSQQRGVVDMNYINPKITITGDNAIVGVWNTEVYSSNQLTTYYMVKENDNWFIMRDKF